MNEITLEDLKKAFEHGRKYEAGELELNTAGKQTAFEVWYEDIFLKKVKINL